MDEQSRPLLGVDVGGTKVLGLLVTPQGQVLARARALTQSEGPTLAEQIIAVVDQVMAQADPGLPPPAALGVAVPGVVDSRTGRFVLAPNLEIDDPELGTALAAHYDLPVALGNDVNLGTLAECWQGAGRGAADVVGIFVGTGIGGGLVLDGHLRPGPEDLAGEIGHMLLQVDGPRCGCGALGCLEALASRSALERDLRAALAAGRSSVIAQAAANGRIRSRALNQALEQGDELVTELMTRLAHYLAQGIRSLRHVVDPELVILGGGVLEACGEFLMPRIEAEVRADSMLGSRDTLRLVISELGDNAVALGAAALARDKLLPAAPEPAAEPEPPPLPEYPQVGEVRFGAVVVGEKELPYDVVIRPDGRLKRRNKQWARKAHGTSHVLDVKELRKVCRDQPVTLVVGEGFSAMLRITDEGREYLRQIGADLVLLPTPRAPEAFNTLEGLKALILHVTC